MGKKDLSTYKRKYQAFRHHAWAGLGFLSVSLAVRIIFPGSSCVLTPIIFVLLIYILVALILTYKYRKGLSSEGEIVPDAPSFEVEKERLKTEVEKQRLKIEKKKAKAEAKKAKKK